MIDRHVRSLSIIPIVACYLLLATGCQSSRMRDPRGDLLRAINGANVDGYVFSLDEDATRSAASLTNPSVSDVITLAAGDTSVPLRYTTIRDRATNTATTYKAELVRSGNSVSYVVTDLATNREVQRLSSDDDPGQPPGSTSCGPFSSCADAERDYECNQKPRLQCEANRVCRLVRGHIECPSDRPGVCLHYHTFVVPNTPRCALRETMVDIDRLLLRHP